MMCNAHRWWTQSSAQCPVSGFPISLLPYPPFRLCFKTASQTAPELYADGKFLALKLVALGNFEVCGRMLDDETIGELESYLRRCKLGTQQLGRALTLTEMLVSLGPDARQQSNVMQELFEIRKQAKQDLKALRKKQECRLSRRERDNRGSKIVKALEVLQKLEDEPGRGAPSTNVATSPPAMWSEMLASPSGARDAPAVLPASTANGLKQCRWFNKSSEHAIQGASSQPCCRTSMQQLAPYSSPYCGPWHGSWRPGCGDHLGLASSPLSVQECWIQAHGETTFSL